MRTSGQSLRLQRLRAVSSGAGLPRKLVFGGLAAGCSGAARFLALLLLARQLGPERFGVLAWYLWAAELGAAIVAGGWAQAVIRYVAEYRAAGRLEEAAQLAGYLARRGLVCGLAALPVVGGLFAFSRGLGGGATFLGAGLYLVGIAGAFAPAWLQGKQAFGCHAALNAGSGVLVIAATWIGAHFGGVGGALAGFLVATVPALAIAVPLLFRRGQRPLDEGEKARVARFTVATWGAGAVSAVVWMRTEILFLEQFVEAAEVGRYASALVFATALTQVVLLFRGVFLPHFSGMAGGGRGAELASAYGKSTFFFALILFPACFFGAALAPVAAGFFGPEFSGSAPLFAVLALGGAVHVFAAGGALASSLERNVFVFWSACGGAVGFVLLCLVLIPLWGVWGAAVARLCGQWGMGLFGAIYLTCRVGIRLPVANLAFTAAAAAAGGAVCFSLAGRESGLGEAVLGLVAGCGVYGGLLLLHPGLRNRIRKGGGCER